MTPAQALAVALQHHQSGRLAEAEAIYRQILAADPHQADALHWLGLIAHQSGRFDSAVDLIRRALTLTPTSAAMYSNLGESYRRLGRLDEAEAACRRAVALAPGFSSAHSNLSVILTAKGRLDDAVVAARQAIALQPDNADAHSTRGGALGEKRLHEEALAAHRRSLELRPASAETQVNIGRILAAQGRHDEAIAAYRAALGITPDIPEAHSNFGNALRETGDLDGAIRAYRQAITLRPDFAEAYGNLGAALNDREEPDASIAASRRAIALKHAYPEAHHNLALALLAMGQVEEAIAAAHQAIALRPDYAEAWGNLGCAFHEKGELDAATSAFSQAHALNPDDPVACCNLGVPLRAGGRLSEAIAMFRRAIALKPSHADAFNSLGNTLMDTGHADEALAAYRQALAIRPGFHAAHSNLLLTMHYHPDLDAETIAEEHRRWEKQHAAPLRTPLPRHTNDRIPERRLRIGYVSPDFRKHPVGHFLLPLLVAHDRRAFEVFCYARVPVPDRVTEKLRAHADHWCDIAGLTPEQVAERILAARVDILVDLSGHTGRNHLLVFARKPAPLQVTWLGYPDTTGLTTMDYRFTDTLADPPGLTEHLHSEQLIRLDPCAWCFLPQHSPEIAARPAGGITFGCFNHTAKITQPMLNLWARILRTVPGARLLLKARGLTDSDTCERIRRLLGENGIAPERLELRGHDATQEEHLAAYARVDIALDTFPYHGTATTCDALWMGVPVVTLAGKTHASRVGVSLLTNAGLPELIAQDEDDYLRIATSLASDPHRLSALRFSLRERLTASPLMDSPRFARDVEAAFRQMWRDWCPRPDLVPSP